MMHLKQYYELNLFFILRSRTFINSGEAAGHTSSRRTFLPCFIFLRELADHTRSYPNTNYSNALLVTVIG